MRAVGVHRHRSIFEFIHSKKRNKLACATVRNIETNGHSDANIDWSSSDEDLD